MTDAQREPSLHELWIEAKARLEAESAEREDASRNAHATTATDAIGRTLRHDGWSPDRQQRFLRLVGEGVTVQRACAAVGMSVTSAYAFRARAAGAAFALGWSAANLLAREPLADGLLACALDGQVKWTRRADGERVERFRYENGLATRMLARLDRQAAADGPIAQAAARLVAGEFDAFLALLGRDEGPARAGLFLAARVEDEDVAPVQVLARADRFARAGGGLPDEVDTADLDLAARGSWTAEQWQRAEAAGLLRVAPAPPDMADEPQDPQLVDPVWWDNEAEDWRTSFPPPDDFDGGEEGRYGDEEYARELTMEERDVVEHAQADSGDGDRAAGLLERERYFAALRGPARDEGSALFGWRAEEGDAPPDDDDVCNGRIASSRTAPSCEEGGIGLT